MTDLYDIGSDTRVPLHQVLDILTEGVGLLLDGLGWDGWYRVEGSGDHNDSYFRAAMRVGLAYLRRQPITDETVTTPAWPDAAPAYTSHLRPRNRAVCATVGGPVGEDSLGCEKLVPGYEPWWLCVAPVP